MGGDGTAPACAAKGIARLNRGACLAAALVLAACTGAPAPPITPAPTGVAAVEGAREVAVRAATVTPPSVAAGRDGVAIPPQSDSDSASGDAAPPSARPLRFLPSFPDLEPYLRLDPDVIALDGMSRADLTALFGLPRLLRRDPPPSSGSMPGGPACFTCFCTNAPPTAAIGSSTTRPRRAVQRTSARPRAWRGCSARRGPNGWNANRANRASVFRLRSAGFGRFRRSSSPCSGTGPPPGSSGRVACAPCTRIGRAG